MILPRINTICKDARALAATGILDRHLAPLQLGEWRTHLQARHIVLHPSLEFVRIDGTTMVNVHCIQQVERNIVRDCEPVRGHSSDHLLF